MIQSGVNQMIGLATLVGTQTHKANVAKDTKKLEQIKELNKLKGKPAVNVLNPAAGMKTKEGKEAAHYEAEKILASAVNPKNQAAYDPSYVESPEDTIETGELVANPQEMARQVAINSVKQDADANNFTQNNIKSNFVNEEAFNRMKERLTYYANANMRDDRGFYANRSVRRDAKKFLEEIDGGNK